MKLALALLIAALFASCASRTDRSAFSDDLAYQPAEWPHLDIPRLTIGAAYYFHSHKQWPRSIEDFNAGVSIWMSTLSLEHPETSIAGLEPLANLFKIVEVIPMYHGVAYRLTYHKKGQAIPGLIVLHEEDSPDAISKTAEVSSDFGGIMYAVPF